MKHTLVFVLCLSSFTCCFALQKPKTKTSIKSSCDDPVGELFVFHMREELRKSSGYTFDPEGTLVINVVCIDSSVSGTDTGLASAISVIATIPYGGQWKNCPATGIVLHVVMYVGRDKTELMAARVLANIDRKFNP